MEYSEERRNSSLILHLEGNLDMLNAGILRDRLLLALDEDLQNIILNLEKVHFVDSSGFGLLIFINDKFFQKTGRKIKISNVAKSIQQVFKISKIGEVIHIYDTLENALNSP